MSLIATSRTSWLYVLITISRASVATNWSIAYRVTTEWRAIVGNDSKVGEHESRIRMLVFDFERALPCSGTVRYLI